MPSETKRIEEMLEAHTRWAQSDGREGKPADLSGLDLRRVKNLSHRMLTALIAPGAILYGVNLEGASLQGSNLAGCDLRAARLHGADLRGVNLAGAKLSHADLSDTNLSPLLIAAERLLPARLDNAEARYADFHGADLRKTHMTGSDFAYANLTGADLRDAEITDVESYRRETADAFRGGSFRLILTSLPHRVCRREQAAGRARPGSTWQPSPRQRAYARCAGKTVRQRACLRGDRLRVLKVFKLLSRLRCSSAPAH